MAGILAGDDLQHQNAKFMDFRSYVTNYTNVVQKFMARMLTDVGTEQGLAATSSSSSGFLDGDSPTAGPAPPPGKVVGKAGGAAAEAGAGRAPKHRREGE